MPIPKQQYTYDSAFRYPLAPQEHDRALRYIFDFAIVVQSLDLAPDALVLDYVSGSCFATEWLNRLGYRTVSLDGDPEALGIGVARLRAEPRCTPQAAACVAGNGMKLPFADEAFDGLICMNSLHHMTDYGAALREIRRVLKPGSRAVFSEPGSTHSRQPESVTAIERGVVERDIVLEEIYRLAMKTGFAQMVIKPYVYPESLSLDYKYFDRFMRNASVPLPNFTQREIGAIIETVHPIFYLQRSGARVYTNRSRKLELVRAKIAVECPSLIRKGERFAVHARCKNIGGCIWLVAARSQGGFVTFGMQVIREGKVIDDSRGRCYLAKDVHPGEEALVHVEFNSEGLAPGSYRLRADMVNEGMFWFHEVGSVATEVELTIIE